MVEVHLLDRLRLVAQRKRWLIGLATSRRCRMVTAALVGVEGTGLAARPEVLAWRQTPLPRDMARQCARLRGSRRVSPADAALLAAQLAERQAVLVDEFAADIAPVWDRLLAIAVIHPGLWRRTAGLDLTVGLCDSARLADMTGQNVIDAFPDRDLAQDGRGRPLLALPNWLLLRDLQKTRLLVECGRNIRLTWLPASRDLSGAARVRRVVVPREEALAECLRAELPQLPSVDELILAGTNAPASSAEVETSDALISTLKSLLGNVPVRQIGELGVPPAALAPAGAALLGVLHLDQTPANLPALTGARTPRVLGRLTPGSLANWHRLVRELATARPSVVALRSAV